MATSQLNKRTKTSKLSRSRPLKRAKTLTIRNHDLSEVDIAWLKESEILNIDTETDGLDFRKDRLRLITISDRNNNVFLVRNPDHLSLNLKNLLERRAPFDTTFHHAPFDLRFLYWWCGIIIPQDCIECTKIMSKILYPKGSFGLCNLVPDVLGVPMDKNMETCLSNWNVKELTSGQINYACNDVLYLNDLSKEMKSQLSKKQLLQTYYLAVAAAVNKAYIEVQGFEETLSYEGKPNEKLRKMWEDRKRVMSNV